MEELLGSKMCPVDVLAWDMPKSHGYGVQGMHKACLVHMFWFAYVT